MPSNNTHDQAFDASDVILYILAFFFPPFPVLIRFGFFTNQFLLNILLTLLFGLPGTIHALYVVYITSGRTGSQERRVFNGDYERLIETRDDAPSSLQDNSVTTHREEENHASTSTNQITDASPPTYEDATAFSNPTDNKLQKL